MPDVFAVLGQDHAEVKQMLDTLEAGPTRIGGASASQLGARKKLVEALIIAESKHEAVEEEYFWPVVDDLSGDGPALAEQGTHQEQLAKVILDRLDKLDPADDDFEELVAAIVRDGRSHIAFEEERVWPRLRELLNPSGAEKLGLQLLRAKDTAPTRPHPNVPPRPGVLKAGGPAAALTDRIRDKITGRGKTR
ncbi:MAG TPA: hemerythrin domain-containing protein [Streptosporangiaceae bacterium]|nr:hemerythrin domain-containing protein [Streptosporangiaceae bacterium]